MINNIIRIQVLKNIIVLLYNKSYYKKSKHKLYNKTIVYKYIVHDEI